VSARHEDRHVVIEVSDDGGGIRPEELTARAIALKLITEEDAVNMSENDALELVYQPGFSTSQHVTQLSGRGIGMDVVRNVVERLKGTIAISSHEGRGTSFSIRLPLTLATVRALLVRVAGTAYALPLDTVVDASRVNGSGVQCVDGRLVIDKGELLRAISMRQLLANERSAVQVPPYAVTVTAQGRRYALLVEEIEGEQELVMKGVEDPAVASELVSGAAILGDGSVALVLNIGTAVERGARLRSTLASAEVAQ
jgi:two-component system chemotaxis sensor kinase CheA